MNSISKLTVVLSGLNDGYNGGSSTSSSQSSNGVNDDDLFDFYPDEEEGSTGSDPSSSSYSPSDDDNNYLHLWPNGTEVGREMDPPLWSSDDDNDGSTSYGTNSHDSTGSIKYPSAGDNSHPPASDNSHPSTSDSLHPSVGDTSYPSTGNTQTSQDYSSTDLNPATPNSGTSGIHGIGAGLPINTGSNNTSNEVVPDEALARAFFGTHNMTSTTSSTTSRTTFSTTSNLRNITTTTPTSTITTTSGTNTTSTASSTSQDPESSTTTPGTSVTTESPGPSSTISAPTSTATPDSNNNDEDLGDDVKPAEDAAGAAADGAAGAGAAAAGGVGEAASAGGGLLAGAGAALGGLFGGGAGAAAGAAAGGHDKPDPVTVVSTVTTATGPSAAAQVQDLPVNGESNATTLAQTETLEPNPSIPETAGLNVSAPHDSTLAGLNISSAGLDGSSRSQPANPRVLSGLLNVSSSDPFNLSHYNTSAALLDTSPENHFNTSHHNNSGLLDTLPEHLPNITHHKHPGLLNTSSSDTFNTSHHHHPELLNASSSHPFNTSHHKYPATLNTSSLDAFNTSHPKYPRPLNTSSLDAFNASRQNHLNTSSSHLFNTSSHKSHTLLNAWPLYSLNTSHHHRLNSSSSQPFHTSHHGPIGIQNISTLHRLQPSHNNITESLLNSTRNKSSAQAGRILDLASTNVSQSGLCGSFTQPHYSALTNISDNPSAAIQTTCWDRIDNGSFGLLLNAIYKDMENSKIDFPMQGQHFTYSKQVGGVTFEYTTVKTGLTGAVTAWNLLKPAIDHFDLLWHQGFSNAALSWISQTVPDSLGPGHARALGKPVALGSPIIGLTFCQEGSRCRDFTKVGP